MINVWLIRSDEYSKEKYWEVVELLQSYPGIFNFKSKEEIQPVSEDDLMIDYFDDDSFKQQKEEPFALYDSMPMGRDIPEFFFRPEKIRVMTWNQIFHICNSFRRTNGIGNNEFVVFLTELGNEHNWFTAGDPSGAKNLFVQTAFWEQFQQSDQRYPVAYHIMTGLLVKEVYKNYADMESYLHKDARGCYMDFCKEKKDVTLKLRTADICPSCLNLLEERRVSKPVVSHVLNVIEGIREQMLFKSRFRIIEKPPTLVIQGRKKIMLFPDFGNMELNFGPLEKTVYLFFLKHIEGVKIPDVYDYKSEIMKIYNSLYTGSSVESARKSAEALCNPLDNSLSEKISRIKKKMITVLGTEIADLFYIQGANGEPKRIAVDRKYIVEEES